MWSRSGRKNLTRIGGHWRVLESGLDTCADGGAGGIRTLDRALQPYNGLANRRLQPLGHSSMRADMPDAGARRKRQIRIAQGHLVAPTDGVHLQVRFDVTLEGRIAFSSRG